MLFFRKILRNIPFTSRSHIKLTPSRRTQFTGSGGPKTDPFRKQNAKSTLYYVTAGGILIAGFSYAAVPLYSMFCQVI